MTTLTTCPRPPVIGATPIGALIGFVVGALITIGDFAANPRIAAHHINQA